MEAEKEDAIYADDIAKQKSIISLGGPNRTLSEQYGLKVYLSWECHQFGPHAVHKDSAVMEELHRQGQEAFENQIGSRTEFMRIFGRNWL